MKLKFNTLLDLLATIFGTIGGVAQLLVVTNRLSSDDGLLISGLATIALGLVANKGKLPYSRPYDSPNYFPLNRASYDSPPYNDPLYEALPQKTSGEAATDPIETPYTSQYESSIQTPYKSKYKRSSKRRQPQRQPESRRFDSARFKPTDRRLKNHCQLPETDN